MSFDNEGIPDELPHVIQTDDLTPIQEQHDETTDVNLNLRKAALPDADSLLSPDRSQMINIEDSRQTLSGEKSKPGDN